MEKKKTSKKTTTQNKKTVVKKTVASKKNKKSHKRAFTLIELLAVIIILGILMVVAIPAVTSYIQNSRKSTYATTAQNVVASARTMVNTGKLDVYDPDTTYYIPYKMIQVENAILSPFGDIEAAYVVVTINEENYDYYWTCKDSSNTGMYLTYLADLDSDSIATNMKAISTDIGIGNRSKIVVFNDDGTIKETKSASDSIGDRESADKSGEEYVETSSSSFVFNSSTGTITGLPEPTASVVINDYSACASYLHDNYWGGTLSSAEDFCRNSLAEELANSPDLLEEFKQAGAITSYTISYSYPKNIVIPEKIDGVAVVSIDFGAFDNSVVETIVIPKTVTNVNSYAFAHASKLYNIVNKTGRTLDIVIGHTSYSLKTGVIPATYFGSVPVIVSTSRASKITIDYDSMFEITDDECKLVNYKGYDVYYYPESYDDGYVKMNIGDALPYGEFEKVIVMKKNNVTYFKGTPHELLK